MNVGSVVMRYDKARKMRCVQGSDGLEELGWRWVGAKGGEGRLVLRVHAA